eukprot:3118458-Heterocapsa_arctica.AAC.1
MTNEVFKGPSRQAAATEHEVAGQAKPPSAPPANANNESSPIEFVSREGSFSGGCVDIMDFEGMTGQAFMERVCVLVDSDGIMTNTDKVVH